MSPAIWSPTLPSHRPASDLDGLHALHFPIAFPEVFLRKRPGFDVIIGNPPWQEATVEEHCILGTALPRDFVHCRSGQQGGGKGLGSAQGIGATWFFCTNPRWPRWNA